MFAIADITIIMMRHGDPQRPSEITEATKRGLIHAAYKVDRPLSSFSLDETMKSQTAGYSDRREMVLFFPRRIRATHLVARVGV